MVVLLIKLDEIHGDQFSYYRNNITDYQSKQIKIDDHYNYAACSFHHCDSCDITFAYMTHHANMIFQACNVYFEVAQFPNFLFNVDFFFLANFRVFWKWLRQGFPNWDP